MEACGGKPGYKIGKRRKCIFHEEEIQMPNKYMKRRSTSLAIRKCRLKIQRGITAYLIEQLKEKIVIILKAGEDAEKLDCW